MTRIVDGINVAVSHRRWMVIYRSWGPCGIQDRLDRAVGQGAWSWKFA